MKLASHLGMSLQRCKRETSSLEFVTWLVWLEEQELTQFSKPDHYLAQIAMEVRRTINPKKALSLKNFLIRFTRTKERKVSTMTEEEYLEAKKKAGQRAAAWWKAALGIKE